LILIELKTECDWLEAQKNSLFNEHIHTLPREFCIVQKWRATNEEMQEGFNDDDEEEENVIITMTLTCKITK
jgi:hypothetical protein